MSEYEQVRILKNLTFQVLVAITLGILLGAWVPDVGKEMKPLGDVFINLIKMVIAPIIFVTIVIGIGNMGDMKKVGRVGGKALLYFEIVTTFAIVIGLIVAHFVQPGAGVSTDHLNNTKVAEYVEKGKDMDWVDFFIHIVPSNAVKAFAEGDILQVVFFSVLFGFALSALGDYGKPITKFFEQLSQVLFKMVNMVMRVAPVGAFGAMAYTIGNFGIKTLLPLGKLMLCVYITMFLFVIFILGIISKMYKFSIWNYLRYIKDEILIVLGTSSSETVLPRMMNKLENYGCSKPVVGLVIPTGYSFNLDGTSIYLSMSVVFLAQAFNVHLGLGQMLVIIGVLMITSKGAAGVTGSGFIVLASTLAALKVIPLEGLALLFGVDRFMSEARAIVNLIGNGVATIVVSKSEGEFDEEKEKQALASLHVKKSAVSV